MKIRCGSFGTVYRAWDSRLEREVALKLLRPSAAGSPYTTSVLREAKLLARIRHPNVVTRRYGADIFEGPARRRRATTGFHVRL